VPTPTSTSGATAPVSFATVITHSVTTTPAERSRPQRSISPPTVSSNAVPPSARYALIAALAAPRLAENSRDDSTPIESQHSASLHEIRVVVVKACIDPAFDDALARRYLRVIRTARRARSVRGRCGAAATRAGIRRSLSRPWQPWRSDDLSV
jgi:hypothetical protein